MLYHLRYDGSMNLFDISNDLKGTENYLLYQEHGEVKGPHCHAVLDLSGIDLNSLRTKLKNACMKYLLKNSMKYVVSRRKGKKREPQWLSLKKVRNNNAIIKYISKEGNLISAHGDIPELLKTLKKALVADEKTLKKALLEKCYNKFYEENYDPDDYDNNQKLHSLWAYYDEEYYKMLGKYCFSKSQFLTVARQCNLLNFSQIASRIGLLGFQEVFMAPPKQYKPVVHPQNIKYYGTIECPDT
jgi:hypothetical protein